MGVLDALKQVLGVKADADATRDADPDDLFGMSTAYVTMEADLDYVPAGEAGLCFAGVDSTQFEAAVDEIRTILDAGSEETGTIAQLHEDDHGYRWIVLEDDDFEDLVTTIHFAVRTLVDLDFGSRLLAAVFAFRNPREDQTVYWIYSFRRGSFYPFVPEGTQERDQRVEFKLEGVLDGELTVEDDKAYWYPLWPDTPGGHPWE
ncbi:MULTISPECIES: PspA-associated protein PspAB [Salinibaculum]|uniref:PspA-associated protein PspAB n=1 Tax=Salinibaculum TaxID=2732368 RepID=UPI0030D1B75B